LSRFRFIATSAAAVIFIICVLRDPTVTQQRLRGN